MFFLLSIINSTIPRKRHAISFPFYFFYHSESSHVEHLSSFYVIPTVLSLRVYWHLLSWLWDFSTSVIQLTQLRKSSCIFLFHKTHDTLPFCSYFWIRLGNLFNISVLDIRHMEFYNRGYRCAYKINRCTLHWLLAAVIANAVHIDPAFTCKLSLKV